MKLSYHYQLTGCLVCFFIVFLTWTNLAQARIETKLKLVSVRNNIEGSFLGKHSIYADQNRIYLVSAQGKLFVLARNRLSNFPVIETIQASNFPLKSVSGDVNYIYITSVDGNLRVYRKTNPLTLVSKMSLSNYGLSSLSVLPTQIFTAKGQADLAVDNNFIYLSQLNEGDVGLMLNKARLVPRLIYGNVFEENSTVVYEKATGARKLAIANPTDIFGNKTSVSVYVDNQVIALTSPGCCGAGIFIYNKNNFGLDQIIPRTYTNSVVRWRSWLIAGNEGGLVDLFDLSIKPAVLKSSLNLQQITGFTGAEDIEIRDIWKDSYDNLIFAGSSWGNDRSRNPSLPAFFVLEMVRE